MGGGDALEEGEVVGVITRPAVRIAACIAQGARHRIGCAIGGASGWRGKGSRVEPSRVSGGHTVGHLVGSGLVDRLSGVTRLAAGADGERQTRESGQNDRSSPASEHIGRYSGAQILVAPAGGQFIGEGLLEVAGAVEVGDRIVAVHRASQEEQTAVLRAGLVVHRLTPSGGPEFAIAAEVAPLERYLAAAGGGIVGAVWTIAGDAESLGIGAAEVGLLRGVAQVGDSDPGLGDELWRKDVVVVEAGAVGGGCSGSLKPAARRTAEEGAKERRLVGVGRLVAEASAQVVFRRDLVVRLDVVAPRILVEREVRRKVVGGSSGKVLGVGQILLRVAGQRVDILQNGETYLVDAGVGKGNEVAAECRAACAALGRVGPAQAVGGITPAGIVDLAGISRETKIRAITL